MSNFAALDAAILSATWPDGGHDGLPTNRTVVFVREAVLASDWLAQYEANILIAERERIAHAIEADMNHNANRNATLATAARIARGTQGDPA